MLSHIIPRDEKGRIDKNIFVIAEEIVIKSASIGGALPKPIIDEVRLLQQKINTNALMQLNSIHVSAQQFFYLDHCYLKKESKNFHEQQVQLYYDFQDMNNVLYQDNKFIINFDLLDSIYNSFEQNRYVEMRYDNSSSLSFFLPSSKAYQLIYVFAIYYFLLWCGYKSSTSIIILDAMLKIILPQYGLWYIAQGFKQSYHEYFKQIKDLNMESPEGFKSFLELAMPLALHEIEAIKKNLNSEYLCRELIQYINMTRFEEMFSPFPKYSELITKELLLHGEIKRGEVKEIINKEQRTSTQLIRDLIDLEYIKSDSPKGVIRLNFPLEIAQFIFQDVFK